MMFSFISIFLNLFKKFAIINMFGTIKVFDNKMQAVV